MKLLYLVPEFPSQTHAFFWREVMGLRSLGVEVTLVSTRKPPPESCRHEFAQQAAAETEYLFPPEWVGDSIYLLKNPKATLRALAYVVRLEQSAWKERLLTMALILPAARLARISQRKGADHLHVHSFANSAHVAALARLLGGCSYSLTLHGDLDVYGTDHQSKTSLARFVICVTTPLKNQVIERLGLPPSTVHVLCMGVDTKQFVPIARSPRDQAEPLRVLTVARLHIAKGHQYAISAIRQLKEMGLDVRYTIVGEGPSRDEIEQQVVANGLTDRILLTGTRSESEIRLLLQSSDILLLPSVGLGEAAPVAVMEAMSCGLPVICSIIGGTRDMIDDGRDGFLVEQKDDQAIVDRIRRLALDVARCTEMGQAARVRAVREFDSQLLASRLCTLIEKQSEADTKSSAD